MDPQSCCWPLNAEMDSCLVLGSHVPLSRSAGGSFDNKEEG